MIAFALLLLHAAVLISIKKWGSKYGNQVKRGVKMISTRPGMCNQGGTDHLCLVATPEKGQEDDKQPCCIAVYVVFKVCCNVPLALRTTTQVEHDIVSWQVCPTEGKLQLMCLHMMAVEWWCNVVQWCYCNCQMLTLNQIECSALALYKLSWRPNNKWCDLAPHCIHDRLVCLCTCYDRCFCASAFVAMTWRQTCAMVHLAQSLLPWR